MSYLQVTITVEVVGVVAVEDPNVPLGRLADGTSVFAPVGRVTAVDGQRRVLCHACGAPLAHIAAAHLARHGLTVTTYRQRFGLSPRTSLTAPKTATIKVAEGHARYAVNTAVHDGLAVGRLGTAVTAEAARTARLAELGHPDDLRGYLRDRYVVQQCGLVTIARELRTSHRTVRWLLGEVGVPTRRPGGPVAEQPPSRPAPERPGRRPHRLPM